MDEACIRGWRGSCGQAGQTRSPGASRRSPRVHSRVSHAPSAMLRGALVARVSALHSALAVLGECSLGSLGCPVFDAPYPPQDGRSLDQLRLHLDTMHATRLLFTDTVVPRLVWFDTGPVPATVTTFFHSLLHAVEYGGSSHVAHTRPARDVRPTSYEHVFSQGALSRFRHAAPARRHPRYGTTQLATRVSVLQL